MPEKPVHVKMTADEVLDFVEKVEHVLTAGHGEIIVQVADHNIVHCNQKAQWSFGSRRKK